MTIKQADDINKKFLDLQDSIKNFKTISTVLTEKVEIKEVSNQKLLDSLKILNIEYKNVKNNYNFKLQEYDDLKKDYVKQRKSHSRDELLTLVAGALWVSIVAILSVK